MAMTQEINTSFTKSLESNCQRLSTLAPKTFRTPISLTRCSAVKEARPKSPRQEMKMAITAIMAARLPTSSS